MVLNQYYSQIQKYDGTYHPSILKQPDQAITSKQLAFYREYFGNNPDGTDWKAQKSDLERILQEERERFIMVEAQLMEDQDKYQ